MAEDELTTIHALVEEEHALRAAGEGVDPERLRRIEEHLDQCWDLLRQRRAHREFSQDESSAAVRPVGTVEGYQQ